MLYVCRLVAIATTLLSLASCGIKFNASILEEVQVDRGPGATVVLTSSVGATSYLGAFTVTATFSEAVSGMAAIDFVLTNGTAGVFTAVSPTVYTLVVTPSSIGAVTINLPAGSSANVPGAASDAATALSVTYDPSCYVDFQSSAASMNLTVTVGGAPTVTWDMGGNAYVGTSATHNFGSAGLRNYQLRVQDGALLTDLDWRNRSISALTIYGKCTGIVTFRIAGNTIGGAIDLSGLSSAQYIDLKNPWAPGNSFTSIILPTVKTNLVTLWAHNLNYNSIDLTGYTNLQNLYLYSPTLSSIDVTTLTSLYSAQIQGNFPSLDISNNPLLHDLVFSSNNAAFTTVNFSANPNLVDVRAYGSNITNALDFSANLNLTYVDIRGCKINNAMSFANNSLIQTLYISDIWYPGGTNITALTLPTVTTNLRDFRLGNNTNITSIDLSAYTNLQIVYLDTNTALSSFNVTGLTAMTSLTAGGTFAAVNLTTNTALTTLSLSSPNLTVANLANNTLLTYLRIAAATMTSVNVTNNLALTTIDLKGTGLTGALDLSVNTALVTIDLSDEWYPANNNTSLLLPVTPTLRTVRVGSSNITTLDISNLTGLQNLYLNVTPINTLTVANNSSLILVNANSIGNMGNILSSIYSQRGIMPNSGTLTILGPVPSAPELVQINDLITTYLWTVSHN